MRITSSAMAMAFAALSATSAAPVAAQSEPVVAAESTPEPGPVQRRLHEEVQRVLLRLVESGELSAQDAEELSLVAPASRLADFGAILDVRFDPARDDGLVVLGVTPGSSADAMGVRPGDRVVGANTTALVGLGADASGRSLAAARLRDVFLEDPEAVRLEVVREGKRVSLSGPVAVVEVPAFRLELGSAIASATLAAESGVDASSTCGRISVLDIAPRSKGLYQAVLISVDGVLPGPSHSMTYRVAPGRHVLTVAEAISERSPSILPNAPLSLSRNIPVVDGNLPLSRPHRRARSDKMRYKTLEIEVQAGVTYRLAAQLHRDVRDGLREGSYWDPVIWKETPERCR